MKSGSLHITVKDIALIGLMVAVIEACKFALLTLPNIELTTFWIIMFAIYFRKRIFFVIPVFILIEGCLFGFGLWCIMYIYLWPMIAIIALIFSKKASSALTWAIISGLFGLMFGFFSAIPYVIINSVGANLNAGLSAAFAWWIAGIPWDLAHGIGNFTLMLVLYHPVTRVMKLVNRF